MNRLREEWGIRPPAEHRQSLRQHVRHFEEAEYTEFTICTPDRPGLFAMITGVLTAHGMNIVGARITTSRGGVALDTFRLGHFERREMVLEPERWERVQQMLERVLRGEVDVEKLVESSGRPSILERAGAGRIDRGHRRQRDRDDYTVLDVITSDRVGVLFAITYALHRLGLVIHLAKITTQVHQVFDVFYVTDASGAKVTDPERLEHVARDDRLAELRPSLGRRASHVARVP